MINPWQRNYTYQGDALDRQNKPLTAKQAVGYLIGLTLLIIVVVGVSWTIWHDSGKPKPAPDIYRDTFCK